MTMHCDSFLVNKTNRRTEFQFFIAIMTLHVSGSLSAHHQEFLSRCIIPINNWNSVRLLVLFTRKLLVPMKWQQSSQLRSNYATYFYIWYWYVFVAI
jgi:hypothetical protein